MKEVYLIQTEMLTAYLNFLIVDKKNQLIACEYFHRSKATIVGIGSGIKTDTSVRSPCISVYKKKEVGQTFEMKVAIDKDMNFDVAYTSFFFDCDKCNLGFAYSTEIGSKYILTKAEWLEEDVYNYLMDRFTFPLIREWTSYIIRSIKDLGEDYYNTECRCILTEGASLSLKNREVPLQDVLMVMIDISEEILKEIVSYGLRNREIKISDKAQYSLDLNNELHSLDEYMTKYGYYLQQNVDKVIHPLVPLQDKVEGFVSKATRPYPQQAAVINGIIALKRKRGKYGFLNCGMGCGKTLMAIGIVEGYFNQKWLSEHSGKTAKDLYMSSDQPRYRTIVMSPGHLVEKWKREIEKEVPGAVVTIINSLKQLVALRKHGKSREGREWYILSKDFCKIGSADAPIPVNMGYQYLEGEFCKECYESEGKIVLKMMNKKGRGVCPQCGERRRFSNLSLKHYGKKRGLICPSCNRLLVIPGTVLNAEEAGCEEDRKMVLQPEDFSNKRTTNDFCANCGVPLWGANCKPVGSAVKKSKWYKITHFSNWSKKNRKTAWVLSGHEYGYFASEDLIDDETGKPYKEMDVRKCTKGEYSPRKYSPATFIKKYLKGFWDFVVLDECHKYAGAGTAQAMAAHALIKTGKFTIGLTGTLTNGKADSLFYLLWMLDAPKMKKKGFFYGSSLEFSRQYGCVETTYVANEKPGTYRAMTKGKQISPPRTKPGINPLVYRDFLLEHSVNMDLSDMTQYMPGFVECVEVIDMPDDVHQAYQKISTVLNNECRKTDGACLLGETLNICLSYPDKPYGRMPIMHPHVRNELILTPPSCNQYISGKLLPKETRLIEIIRQEMEENRNVFVFANFTGKEESNITVRLQEIIEKECALKGRVEVLRAETPEAIKREAYIHERAKAGIRVVITNAKVCETGLDFCFEEDGIYYNYPTIIFVQITYELATMMQASRRHYRLNQTQECRTYWMAYSNTIQTAALQIMASKQVAAAAIQGKFSAEGLASMAQGVDPRILLAKKLADGDNSSREELNSMFDVLAKCNAGKASEINQEYIPPQLYFELMGEEYHDDVSIGIAIPEFFMGSSDEISRDSNKENTSTISIMKKAAVNSGQLSLFSDNLSVSLDILVLPVNFIPGKRRKMNRISGQLSLF